MKPTIHANRALLPVLAAALIGAATLAPAATAAPQIPTPTPAVIASPPAPLLHILPAPLDCLVTTGFALWCIGIT